MIDIKTFFEQSEGKWFTQRTQYNLTEKQVENDQAELTVELLPADDRAIADLYSETSSQFQADLPSNVASAKISWDVEGDKGANLILLLPKDEAKQQGQLIQKPMNPEQPATIGNFVIGEDEALTLSTPTASNRLIKERVWFAHPNLRLRTVWQETDMGQQGSVLFYSEIRRMNS